MYKEHVPIISAWSHASIDGFKSVAMFAVLSARQPFIKVPDQLAEIKRLGSQATGLWSWKIGAHKYIQKNATALFETIDHAPTLRDKLFAITRVPGIGLVKGAFVLQMMGYDIACLDTWNIEADNRNPRAFRSDGDARKSTAAFMFKIDRYVSETGGKAEFYWDRWCNMVGKRYVMSGEACSAIHLAVVPEHMRKKLVPLLVPVVLTETEIPF